MPPPLPAKKAVGAEPPQWLAATPVIYRKSSGASCIRIPPSIGAAHVVDDRTLDSATSRTLFHHDATIQAIESVCA